MHRKPTMAWILSILALWMSITHIPGHRASANEQAPPALPKPFVRDSEPPGTHLRTPDCVMLPGALKMSERHLKKLIAYSNTHPVTCVSLINQDTLSDKSWQMLSDIRGLKNLDLYGAKLAPVTLAAVNALDALETLDLSVTSADDAFVQGLQVNHLKQLNLTLTNITVSGLKTLTRFKELEWLGVSSIPNFAKPEVDAICALTQLTGLSLHNRKLGDTELGCLAKLTALKSLNLTTTRVGGKTLSQLATLQSLERLSLEMTPTTDHDVELLATLPKLHCISLQSTPITSASLKALFANPTLKMVNLVDTGISARDVVQAKPKKRKIKVQLGEGGMVTAPCF